MQCTYNGQMIDIIMDKQWTYNSESSSELEQYLILAKIVFWLATYFILGIIAFWAGKIFYTR